MLSVRLCLKTMLARVVHATANRPGAIAILQLLGDCEPILRAMTGVSDWPLHHVRLVDFSGIDQGLAMRMAPNVAQLMPHGGPRVVQKVTARLIELGAKLELDPESAVNPQSLFPEATDRIEALMMLALGRAHSPVAIDLLLDQPRRWRQVAGRGLALSDEDMARSRRLNRLIDPPIVVLAGRPNVGKSTLSNALLGRSMSIAHDMPGTTIDYTAGRMELGGLVVDWHDTPGIRATHDPIERKAVELATRLMKGADLLIAISDQSAGPGGDSAWPRLPRDADLRVLSKSDLPRHAAELPTDDDAHVISISAKTGEGLAALVASAREALVRSSDLDHPGPWLFDERLTTGPSPP
jgi:tRNA modification GTPase